MTEVDINTLRSIFQSLDSNKDGIITICEFKHYLSSVGQDFVMKEFQAMVKKADKDGDGKINFEEFLEMMIKAKGYNEKETIETVKDIPRKEKHQKALAAFRAFDKDNDGLIDIRELKTAMKQFYIEEDPVKVENLLKNLDKNGDGVIDFVEFEQLLSA